MSKTWSIKIGRCKAQYVLYHENVWCRETREGWPLLTVETQVNWDSKSTNERGPFLWWVVRLVVPVKEIFVLPWLL
jgi:hypothetical protein